MLRQLVLLITSDGKKITLNSSKKKLSALFTGITLKK